MISIPYEPFKAAPWWGTYSANPYATRGRGPCPRCGGSKRFQLRRFPDGQYAAYCWVCGYTWFANGKEKTEQPIAKPSRRRFIRTPRQKDWLTYYYAGKMPEARMAWCERGVAPESIYRFRLGYCPQRKWWTDGEIIEAPSLVIPYFDLENRLCYIQHRILGHDERIRYRPEYKAITPPLWLSVTTNVETYRGRILFIVEGAIKGIVLAQTLRYRNPVIAYISSNADKSMLPTLIEAYMPRLICHIPDPDAKQAHLPTGRVTQIVVSTPEKVDDWIRHERLTRKAFWQFLRQNGIL